MKAEFTAMITKEDDWWLGWVEEIPGANAQEKTKEALLSACKPLLAPGLIQQNRYRIG